MGQLFIYIGLFIGVGIIAFRLLAWVVENLFKSNKKSSFLNGSSLDDEMPRFASEPREFEIIDEKESNLINLIFKRIPSLITMWSLGIVLSMLFGAYLSTANIDRLAASGAALEAGNTGLALSYLWPMGKDIAKDQYRLSSGTHPVIEKSGLKKYGFKYLGLQGNSHIAIMQNLVTAGDIDPSIKSEDPDYSKIIYGSTVDDAQDVCENFSDRIAISVIKKSDWDFSFSHILSKKNINRYPDIAEWFEDLDPDDNDNYMLNFKGNPDIKEKLKDGKGYLAGSEAGIFYDEDNIHDYINVAYRCAAVWPKNTE